MVVSLRGENLDEDLQLFVAGLEIADRTLSAWTDLDGGSLPLDGGAVDADAGAQSGQQVITFTFPNLEGLVAAPAIVYIEVRNPDGQSASSASYYEGAEEANHGPQITTLLPAAYDFNAPSFILFFGQNFSAGMTIHFLGQSVLAALCDDYPDILFGGGSAPWGNTMECMVLFDCAAFVYADGGIDPEAPDCMDVRQAVTDYFGEPIEAELVLQSMLQVTNLEGQSAEVALKLFGIRRRKAAMEKRPVALSARSSQIHSYSQTLLPTLHGDFQCMIYRDQNGMEHVAMMAGPIHGEEPVLCRVHSACFTSEVLGSTRCDCKAQLDVALQKIAKEGRADLPATRRAWHWTW